MQQLIAGEEIVRGYLGVQIQPMTEELAKSMEPGFWAVSVENDKESLKTATAAG